MLASREEMGARDVDEIGYAPATSDPFGDIRLRANRANDYLIDWETHKTRRFGILGVNLQDICVTENQGPTPIMDRTQENLCPSDITIITARKHLLQAARALRKDGTVPKGVVDPSIYRVRATSTVMPDDVDWVEGIKDEITVPKGGQ